MRRAIREHLKDFIAIIVLVVLGLGTTAYILANQATALPSWVPILGEERFELNAEFSTAQAVTPGQGQAVNIAGIQVGRHHRRRAGRRPRARWRWRSTTTRPELINEDATMLLRPKTGLNDMTIEVDPGVSDVDVEDGETLPLSSTLPNVNPDEVLAALDADTQAFLKLLVSGGGEALDPEQGRGVKLSQRAAPVRAARPQRQADLRRAGASAARASPARSTTSGSSSEELGNKDTELTGFIDSSNAVLEDFASQEAAIRASLRELPGTLQRDEQGARRAPTSSRRSRCRRCVTRMPGARALKPALQAVEPFFRETTAPDPRPDPPVHQAGLRARRSTCARRRRASAARSPPLKTSVTANQREPNALAGEPRGRRRGLPLLPRLAQPQRRTTCSCSRTRRGRCAAASCC